MAIIQLKIDERDRDTVHIYSTGKRQLHIAAIHINAVDDLFEMPLGEYDYISEALMEKDDLWITFNPKIQEDM